MSAAGPKSKSAVLKGGAIENGLGSTPTLFIGLCCAEKHFKAFPFALYHYARITLENRTKNLKSNSNKNQSVKTSRGNRLTVAVSSAFLPLS